MQSPTVDSSSLLIISHDKDNFNCLSSVLQHYFPNSDQNKSGKILISNKYYKANVKLQSKFWKQVVGFQSLQDQEKKETNQASEQMKQIQSHNKQIDSKKYDLMIMLVNQNQQSLINFQSLDSIIQKFNPQQFVLLINTTNPQQSWKHQQTILEKCNNFIEIVKENLEKVWKFKPLWARGALLQDEEEADDSGIFSILDRMETTRWTTLVDVKKEEKKVGKDKKVVPQKSQINEIQQDKEEHNIENIEQNHQTESIQKQIQTQKISLPLNLKQEEQNISSDEQPDQNKLQSQMLEFQKMMSQMLAFKTQSVSMKDDERKNKAEELFSKMFTGMINK